MINTFVTSSRTVGSIKYFILAAYSGASHECWGDENGYDYTYDTEQDLFDALDNGEIVEVRDIFRFDVYVNGTDLPSIGIQGYWEKKITELADGITEAAIWEVTYVLMGFNDLNNDEKGTVPDTDQWYVGKVGGFTAPVSFQSTYLTVMENFSGYVNAASKVIYWGTDSVPNYIEFMLQARYDNDSQRGDLYRVSIPRSPKKLSDITSELIAGSMYQAKYDTRVVVHFGEDMPAEIPDDSDDYPSGTNADGDGDGRYDPNNPPDPSMFDDSEGIGFDGNAVLTKTYSVSAATLQNVGQKLWTQSYFDVLKIQNNPIENIISVKGFPFETSGTAETIKVGDVSFGINGDKIASVVKKTIGTCKYTGHFGNYLDLSPYTLLKINLPYIGLVQLDTNDLFNSTLKVDYIIDMVTGDCMAMLTLDGIPYMNVNGRMGVDIPLTSSDRVQTELRTASAAISAVGGTAGQVISGNVPSGAVSGVAGALSIAGADYTTQRTSNPSAACNSFQNHRVFLQVERPLSDPESAGYKHLHGYPCHKYVKLSSLSGFVAVDRRTDIQIAMTSEENAMLERLLTEGIYI
jgi:hypothetical protein